jgi:hypothetical protein
MHAASNNEINNNYKNDEPTLIVYSHSPVFYWWPIWFVGLIMAAVSYLDGGRMAWLPDGADAQRTWQVHLGDHVYQEREGILLHEGKHLLPNRPEQAGGPLPPPNQPHVRMSRHKFLGFAFAVVLFFVYLHSNVLWRGFRAYFFLALGVSIMLAVMVMHLAFPEWGVWSWVKYVIYQLPDIYISMDGYLYIASIVLFVWLLVTLVYDHLTYMRFESGQVHVVEEIGEGETVYDTTNMTFEKQKADFFRHYMLGLGFLRPLRHFLPRVLARRFGIGATTGAGDLIVRVGGDSGRVIAWPNVLNADSKLEAITTFIKSRPVVAEHDARLHIG